MYFKCDGNVGKSLYLVQWDSQRFTILLYIKIDEAIQTHFTASYYRHENISIPQYEFFKLDEDEVLRHYVMETI